ncbi:undecaprenyl-diphosphatase [Longispora fulva]|uniref:Undecaprenyl-diphosphatase n=1 Tax=Longispora fulva TaxID=619741 RepID=A0A8J7KPM8_9ACTN|nr:phosphatase PAP2 family protein [Longispora fulva]MBG6136482.1 undecaprenyl-diphosphatase [Longispora fulva]GIG59651.1 undecaprenyl-diphosphatase [Longispora fulva]
MNYQIFQLINGLAGRVDALDDAMEATAQWLIFAVFAVGAALVALAVRRRRYRQVALLGVALAVAFVASQVLAQLNGQLRPFQTHHVHQLIAHDNGVSLPSDHATAAFAIAFGVAVFLNRRWGAVLAVAAAAIGLARVWVGVHYPGDILAAAVIAAVATGAVWLVDKVHRRRSAASREA